MSQKALQQSRVRKLLVALLGVTLVSGWLWWLDRGSPGPAGAQGRRSTSVTDGGAQSETGTPSRRARAALPVRTDISAEDVLEASGVQCPLLIVDADGIPTDTPSTMGGLDLTLLLDSGRAGRVSGVVTGTQLSFPPSVFELLDSVPSDEMPMFLTSSGELIALQMEGRRCVRAVYTPSMARELLCPIEGDWDPVAELLFIRGNSGQIPWTVRDDSLAITVLEHTGQADLYLTSGSTVSIGWSGERCDAVDLDARLASLEITVTDRRMDPLIWLTGCGMRPRRVVANVEETIDVVAEPCVLEAWRTDGALRALADPVYIDPLPGDVITLQMDLPEHRMAGMGIAFAMGEDAAEVRSVRPNSPAWDAGLRSGDRIVGVDGEPTDGMTDNDFIAFGTGPEGTEVRIVVQRDNGTTEEISIERVLIER